MKVIDPVCKMTVDTETAKHSCEIEGIKYYFCSSHCKESFSENPKKYLKKPGLVARFIDWLAAENEKTYGTGKPSCH